MTRRTFSRLPTLQSPFSSCGPFSTFSHRSTAFCKSYNWHWFIAGLLPVDALPPCQSCQPLDVGPHFPRGYMGICQVQVCRGQSSRCSWIKIGIPQWGVQRGGCADWGADRKGVGQLLPAHPEQGEAIFLFREYLSDFAWVCPRWCCFYIKLIIMNDSVIVFCIIFHPNEILPKSKDMM